MTVHKIMARKERLAWILGLLLIAVPFGDVCSQHLWQSFPFQLSYPPIVIWPDTTEDALYVGGDFRYVDSIRVDKVIRYDGVSWDTLPKRVPLLQVGCFARYQDKLYVGGNGGFAVWDGQDWQLIPCDGAVGLMKQHKGKLIIAGSFQVIGGDSICAIASWDGQSISDPFRFGEFLGTGNSGWIASWETYQEEIYVAGNFNGFGAAADILRWNASGWNQVGDGIQATGMDFITDMEIYAGELYVTGSFQKSRGSFANSIARWNGIAWSEVGEGVGPGQGHDLQLHDGKLILGGSFYFIENTFAPFLASWDGTSWCKFGGDLDNAAYRMTEFEGELLVSGAIRDWGGDSIYFLGKWVGGNTVDTCISYPVGAEMPASNSFASVSLHPNPTHSAFSLTLPDNAAAPQIQIRDPQGRAVALPQAYTGTPVDVSALARGLYFVEVSWRGGHCVLKLLKE